MLLYYVNKVSVNSQKEVQKYWHMDMLGSIMFFLDLKV